jgi:hypothetical protein
VHGDYPFTFTYYYDNPATVDVQSDETYYAWYYGPSFVDTSVLTVSSSGGGSVMVQNPHLYGGGYAFETGTYANVTPVAGSGYVFSY